MEYPDVRVTGQGEIRHRKYNKHTLGGGQVYDVSID
jgi:hypothetical protein